MVKQRCTGNLFATHITQLKAEVTTNTSIPSDTQFASYYQKHQKSLKLCGLQPKTIEAYSRVLRRIGNYFDSQIDNLTTEQLLEYFHDLLEHHSWSTVKLDLYSLKFFYSQVLNKTWEDIRLVKPPKTSRIPDILTVEQMNRLFGATNRLSYRDFFFTAYSLGLRLGEGIRLSVGDIDPTRMRVHISDSKGNKDRLVLLPEKTLYTPESILDSAQAPSRPLSKPKERTEKRPSGKATAGQGWHTGCHKVGHQRPRHKKNLMPLATSQLCNAYAGGRCSPP